jgi:hypothetical protein
MIILGIQVSFTAETVALIRELISALKPPPAPRPILEGIKFMFRVSVDQPPVPFSVDLSGLTFTDDKGNVIANEKAVVNLESDNDAVQVLLNPADDTMKTTGTLSFGPTPSGEGTPANLSGSLTDPATGNTIPGSTFGAQIDVTTGAVAGFTGAINFSLEGLTEV